MIEITELKVGEIYSNNQISLSLAVENLGGIRPSIDPHGRLRHLAILSSNTDTERSLSENPYSDRIEGDVLLFTGQGREGDQELRGRNRRLLDQYTDPVPYFGFLGLGRQRFQFLGLLELLRHYHERQNDTKGNARRVLVYEFRIHTLPSVVPLVDARRISQDLLQASRDLTSDPALERQIEAVDTTNEDHQHRSNISSVEILRAELLTINPYRFEQIAKMIMELNGFVDVSVTRSSNDGGIDVNAYASDWYAFFDGTHVQAQVKRWRHSVGSVELGRFRGALSVTAKGIFITTSQFTKAAVAEARHPAKPSITLIDGMRLSSLILRSNIDISRYAN